VRVLASRGDDADMVFSGSYDGGIGFLRVPPLPGAPAAGAGAPAAGARAAAAEAEATAPAEADAAAPAPAPDAAAPDERLEALLAGALAL
jgi:hypothetical protein